MDWGFLLLLALIWALGIILFQALSFTFRKNRWGERQRDLTERIGCGIFGLLIILFIVGLALVVRAF